MRECRTRALHSPSAVRDHPPVARNSPLYLRACRTPPFFVPRVLRALVPPAGRLQPCLSLRLGPRGWRPRGLRSAASACGRTRDWPSLNRTPSRAPASRAHLQRKKRPRPENRSGSFVHQSLAVSYFHMGRPHTIIGAERFHFRVRKGIGWFPLAMAARQTFADNETG